MADVFKVPVNTTFPSHSFRIDFEGVIYTLRFRYNTRMSRWIMDIADAANNDIINGLPVLLRYPLHNRFVREALPPGGLLAYDESGQQEQPERNDFAKNHILLYVDSDV